MCAFSGRLAKKIFHAECILCVGIFLYYDAARIYHVININGKVFGMKKISAFCAALFIIVNALLGETRSFSERTDIFSNPGQGFSSFSLGFNRNAKVNYGAGYIRYDWADLNPEDGVYDFEPIERAMEFFSEHGLPFYFRIMCANFHSGKYFSAPEWVFRKGAKFSEFEGMEYDADGGKKSKLHAAPRFDDPVFIAEHGKFIKALAERFDGDPRLGGLDLGSFGNWGEWHCHGLGLGNPNMYPFEVRKRYADMYLENFRKSDLFFMTDDAEIFAYARGDGKEPRVGMRRDGVGSPGHFKRWIGTETYKGVREMGDIWKYKPVFFEFYGDVDFLKKEGWDVVFSAGWLLDNHVSLINEIPLRPEMLKDGSDWRKAIDRVCLFAGARLVPQRAEAVYADGKLSVKISGVNKGASRIYLPYRMIYEVRDSSGKLAARQVSSCDPCGIFPGDFEIYDNFEVFLAPGRYSLSLRICHTGGVFRDFLFAVKTCNADGSLDLGGFDAE